MSENSSIEWCDHTFNPWIGCTKVSPGCANCYAETQDKFRSWTPQGWGKGKPRKRTSEANWKQPLKWNREDERKRVSALHSWPAGKPMPWRRPRVFCASLADWLDDEVPTDWLSDLIYLICKCNHLNWLLLTKRPQLWRSRLEAVSNESDLGAIICRQWLEGNPPKNVWIGTTVEDQARAVERVPVLIEIPAKVRFLSCEPLLGPVDLRHIHDADGNTLDALTGDWGVEGRGHTGQSDRRIHWVITGGESGPGARPMHPAWARSLRDQSAAAGVPFLFKQWGENIAHPSPDATWNDGSLVPSDLEPVRYERVGKKAAGRLLDGCEWTEFPTGKDGSHA